MRYQKTSVEMGSKKLEAKNKQIFSFPNVALSANAFCFQLFRNIFLDPFQKIWDQHEIMRFFIYLVTKIFGNNFLWSYMYFLQILNAYAKGKKLLFCKYISIWFWIPSSFENWRPQKMYGKWQHSHYFIRKRNLQCMWEIKAW